jgi:hypothetical protein
MSNDESNAYEMTRREEVAAVRNEAIIAQWKASKTLDILSGIAADLLDDEWLTTETLRVVRLDVDRMATQQRDKIIREWEDAAADDLLAHLREGK